MKKHIFRIIQIGSKDDLPSRLFDYFIVTSIIVNITVAFLYTFDELESLYGLFTVTETVTLVIFIAEYILRLWTADLLYKAKNPALSRLKFLFSFDGIIDLLTILPFFYLSGFIAFRMLRVVRIFRLFRLNAQYDSFNVITTVIKEKRNQILSSLFIILILMMASSLGIYNAEHEAQPEVYKNAFSGIWWSVSTLLTVGYGDIYPVTTVGKIIAIFSAFLGVGAVAVPTGIISAGFVEQYTQKQNSDVNFSDVSHIGEILVGENDKLNGITVAKAREDFELHIYVVLRDDLTVFASDSLTIKPGDLLITSSSRLVREKN